MMKFSTYCLAADAARRMAAALAVAPMLLCAATMTASAAGVTEGDTYYIYNVGQGKFLSIGADRKVTLADAGSPFTLSKAQTATDSREHATATTAGRQLYTISSGSAALTLALTSDATDVEPLAYDQWALTQDDTEQNVCYLDCRTLDANALSHLYYSQAEGAVDGTTAGVDGLKDAEWMMVSEEVYLQRTVTLREDATQYALPTVPDGMTVGVNLYRKLVADVWNSFCVPFAIGEEEMRRVFGDGYRLMELTAVSDGVLNFSERKAAVAGTPYLLRLSQVKAAGEPYVIGGVTGFVAQPSTITLSDDVTHYTCRNIAAFYKTQAPKGAYVFNSDKLYHLQNDMSMGGFRGYFFISDGEGTAAKLSTWVLDESTTGIDATGTANDGGDNGTQAVYSAAGQLLKRGGGVASLPHGTLIMRQKDGKTIKLNK